MDILFLVGRIVLGVYFVVMGVNHFRNTAMIAGYAKMRGLPAPALGAVVSGLFLLLGGVGVLLGLYIEISLWLLIIFLVSASFGIHHFWTDKDPMHRTVEMTNFSKNLALAAALLVILGLL